MQHGPTILSDRQKPSPFIFRNNIFRLNFPYVVARPNLNAQWGAAAFRHLRLPGVETPLLLLPLTHPTLFIFATVPPKVVEPPILLLEAKHLLAWHLKTDFREHFRIPRPILVIKLPHLILQLISPLPRLDKPKWVLQEKLPTPLRYLIAIL